MKKTRKRLTALGLSVAMMLGLLAGCGDNKTSNVDDGPSANVQETEQGTEQTGKDLSWLNSSQTLPLVEEGTEKTLNVYVLLPSNSAGAENTWFYKYIEEAMNINLEVTSYTTDNRNEVLSLAFASGELPDLILYSHLNSTELIKYGKVEGQIMDMAPYLNETYMPNLTAIYEEHPEYKSAIQDSEGHIWSFGYIGDVGDYLNTMRPFLNYDYLDELGLKVPETLDEFIDTMRAFKENGLCEYPLGGSYSGYSPLDYIFNAYGYMYCGVDVNGKSVCLRNGEVVLPVADREVYGDFLSLMKECYDEGLIHPDFFTMDMATDNNVMSSGAYGFYMQAPLLYMETYQDWWGAVPLTSEYNDTPQWACNVGMLSAGEAVVTSACEEPELAATFIDWFYTFRTYTMSQSGPHAEYDADYLYGFDGWIEDPEAPGNVKYLILDKEPDINTWDYNFTVRMWDGLGIGVTAWDETSYMSDPNAWRNELKVEGIDDLMEYASRRHEDEKTLPGGNTFKCSMGTGVGPYLSYEVLPKIIYFDEETGIRIQELGQAISEYASQEMAKFITGVTSLDELDNYFDTIEELGATELVQIYADYYEGNK